MNLEGWAKLLATYGPFALLVLLVFVIERRAWAELRDQEHPRKAVYLVYGGTWVAIFAVCAVVVWVWILLNIPKEFTVRGRLVGLGKAEQLFSRSEDTYLRRAYSGNSTGNFVFRIISSKKLVGDEPVELVIDHGDNTESVFQLTIESWFYDDSREVRLTYDGPPHDRLTLHEPAGSTEVPRLVSSIRVPSDSVAEHSGFSEFLFPTVHAQSGRTMTFDDFAAGLDSPDPIIRMDTRQSVMKAGRGASPYLESVLYDPGSSTRMLIGVLNILNSGGDVAADLDKQAQCNIQDFANSSDTVLRPEAQKFLASHPRIQTLTVCKPIPGRSFDCRDPRLIEFDEGGVRRFTVGRQHLYVWQRSLSTDDPNWATVYAIEDESVLSPEKGSLKKNDFAALESRLQKIDTGPEPPRSGKDPVVVRATLRPESYAIFKVRNRDTIEVELSGGGRFALFIRDTHYVSSNSNFQACLP